MKERDGFMLKIDRIEIRETPVKVSRGGKIIINGKATNMIASNYYQYPDTVRIMTITLNNGEEMILADNAVPHLVNCFYWRRYHYKAVDTFKNEMKVSFFVPYRNGEKHISFNFWEMEKKKMSDILYEEKEPAFHRKKDGRVTNSFITFPKKRPFGTEWQKKYKKIAFAKAIKEENWERFLECIIGKFFSEVNTASVPVTKWLSEAIYSHKVASRIEKIVGQCFDSGTLDQNLGVEVGIGEKLLFKGMRDGKEIFAVDSPNYGVALYLFRQYEDAKKWATNKISWKEAEALAFSRIIHCQDWQERAEERIAS
jgi:hypothetical protein